MINIALAQYAPPWGDPHRARHELIDLIDGQLQGPVDIIVAPEMATSGYIWPSPRAASNVAEIAKGPSFATFAPLAKAHGAYLVYGFPEVDGGMLYNSLNIINPAGELALTYRKYNLFFMDEYWSQPGDLLPTLETPLGPIAPGICADINSPTWCAHAFHGNHRLVPFPTNWVDRGHAVHSYWRTCMGESQTLLLAANRWGWEYSIHYSGESAILTSHGPCLHAPPEGNGLLLATHHPDHSLSGRWRPARNPPPI